MTASSLVSPHPSGARHVPSAIEIAAMARSDLWCFIELMFPVLHPGTRLVYADYLGLMATLLMSASERKYRRLIFNLPPRHMKSLIVSIMYPAWRLGRDPGVKFICISYGDDLAHDHSAMTRKIMQSSQYRMIFPNVELDKKAVDHIRTSKGGYRYATSIGSDITGFGADEIIIDDPMQPDEAGSEKRKQDIRSWVQSSVLTRFNDPSRGVLMLVMHRLAPDDLSGTMEASADFVLKLPLIAADKQHFTSKNKTILLRAPGDILNPNRMTDKDVEDLKLSLPKHVFDSQYQQQPTVGGSGMISLKHFRRYDLSSMPAFELTIHSWDIGATITGNASVCTKWGLVRDPAGGDALYLTDVLRLRLELPEVRAAIRAQRAKDRPALIVLDERGVGLGVCQELQREFRNVIGSTATTEPVDHIGAPGRRPNAGKIERFGQAALAIADGRVLIPTTAPWLESFLYEIASFPNIPDKDQVDSMTQLVAHINAGIWRARLYRDRGWT
ncbi:MAG: hypothetical protein ACK4MV_12750 [Beijerinckiaceae bacterium]